MAAVTHVRAIDYVARMLDEDVELLEAIISNHDNLTCGNITNVYVSLDETLISLTNDAIQELEDMIQAARINTKIWHTCLKDFVADAELVTQIKAKSPG